MSKHKIEILMMSGDWRDAGRLQTFDGERWNIALFDTAELAWQTAGKFYEAEIAAGSVRVVPVTSPAVIVECHCDSPAHENYSQSAAPNPAELVDGIETTTFAGIVLALYVKRVVAGKFGSVDMVELQQFSGLSQRKLARMRDAEAGNGMVSRTTEGSARNYYEPTKFALAKALAESLALAADEKAIHDRMPRECRP